MRNRNSYYRIAGEILRLAAGALALLALVACGGDGGQPAGSPTAPPGMFSTLPTTEPPAAGDQAPTIELNTPEPTLTPNPTPTPNPTYTPVPTLTPLPSATPVPTLAPTGTPVPTGSSHARADSDAESHADAAADLHSSRQHLRLQPTYSSVATAHLHTVPDVYAETDGRAYDSTHGCATRAPAPVPTAMPVPGFVPLPRGSDALFSDIWRNDIESARTLIDGGVAVNVSDKDGDPFLHEAIWRNHQDMVQLLVDSGADVNARDSDNDPLLHSAICYRDMRFSLSGRGR